MNIAVVIQLLGLAYKIMQQIIKRNQKLIITVLVLVFLYCGLMLVAPRLTLWNMTSTYHPDNCVITDISEGQSFEYSFPIPYDYVNTVEVLFTDESRTSSTVIPFDAHLELLDSDGNVVIGKDMTSIFDTTAGAGYTRVAKGETYTVRFTVSHVDNFEGASVPQVQVSSENGVAFDMTGRYNGAPSKGVFSLIYVLFSIVVVLYVYSMDCSSVFLKKSSELLLLLAVAFVSILMFSQIFDPEMIIRGALKIIETTKAGNPLAYYDYSYTSSLIAGSNYEYLAHNLDFFLLLPVAIVMLPLSFFMNSADPYNGTFTFAIILLSIVVFLAILISGRLIMKICKVCDMPEDYSNTVRRLFIFSPFLLSATILFGQIDMLYIVVVIAALLMYYQGRYGVFSILMSIAIAMKTLPIMIFIPLILLVKKKPVPLISYCVGAVSFTLLSTVLFKGGFGYDAIMNVVKIRYDFMSTLFASPLGIKNDFFPICYALICIYGYMHNVSEGNKRELLRSSMTLIFATYSTFVVFTDWHAQWLIPLILSMSFLLPFYKKNNTALLLNIAAEVLLIFCSYGSKTWSMYMTNFILPTVTGYYYNGPTLTTVYNSVGPWCYPLICSLCSAVLIALCYIFFSKNLSTYNNSPDMSLTKDYACLRVTVIYAVIAFFLWCYFFIG